MTMKQKIEDIIRAYAKERERLRDEIRVTMTDDRYSDTYRVEMVKGTEEKLANAGIEMYKNVEALLDSVKKAFTKQLHGKVPAKDMTYQLRLSNTLEMVRLGAKEMAAEDMQEAIRPFADDAIAMAAFRGVLAGSGLAELEVAAILRPFNREKILAERMRAFLNSIRAVMDESPVHGMELAVASSLFMLSRWNDDMNGWVDE